MIRDKEIDALQSELDNYKSLYNRTLETNSKLRKEIEELKKGNDSRLKELKAENGILERTIDVYVRKLAKMRATQK